MHTNIKPKKSDLVPSNWILPLTALLKTITIKKHNYILFLKAQAGKKVVLSTLLSNTIYPYYQYHIIIIIKQLQKT